MSEQFRKASEIVAALFSGMEQESLERSNKLVSGWKEIVGPKISAHSRILDLDKNNLIVEVDHPGWSQQILLSKKNIIRSLSRNFPELIIKNVIIRVVSECNEPYVKKNDDVVGAGIPRSSETEPDVEVRQDLDENLKKILEKLKESIRKGKRDE